jgi:hypothetical protein
MSITRQLFNEFRPLFRLLEEPLSGRFGAFGIPSRSIFDDPFFTAPRLARPAVDITEDGNHYVVETELPGVKKEDVEVRIGDCGRSITIEGNIIQRSVSANGGDPNVSNTVAPQAERSSEGGHTHYPRSDRRLTCTKQIPRWSSQKKISFRSSGHSLAARDSRGRSGCLELQMQITLQQN